MKKVKLKKIKQRRKIQRYVDFTHFLDGIILPLYIGSM